MTHFPSASELAEATVLQRELVEIPELGWKFYVQELSGDDYLLMLEKMGLMGEGGKTVKISTSDLLKVKPFILSRGIVDEDGSPIFTEEQASRLGAKYQVFLTPYVNRVLEMSGLAKKEAKDNLKNDHSDASLSNSQENLVTEGALEGSQNPSDQQN